MRPSLVITILVGFLPILLSSICITPPEPRPNRLSSPIFTNYEIVARQYDDEYLPPSLLPLIPGEYFWGADLIIIGGDCIHDMDKNIGNMGLNVVPTHLSRVPNWGPASNDDYFATVQGEDNFPDLYVGRFPARTSSEMKLIVNKTVNYLLYPEHGYWKDNMILIGGVEQDFTVANNDMVKSIIGPKMNVFRIELTQIHLII